MNATPITMTSFLFILLVHQLLACGPTEEPTEEPTETPTNAPEVVSTAAPEDEPSDDEPTNCNIIDEWYKYVKTALLRFGDNKMVPVYQTNIDFFVKGQKPTCYLKESFPSSGDPNCKHIRDFAIKEIMTMQKSGKSLQPTVNSVENAIDGFDIDSEEVCSQLYKFNKKPESEKKKEEYADLFVSSIAYIPYALIESVIDPCNDFSIKLRECIEYTNNQVKLMFNKKPDLRKWPAYSC